jgi:hypothetical protein
VQHLDHPGRDVFAPDPQYLGDHTFAGDTASDKDIRPLVFGHSLAQPAPGLQRQGQQLASFNTGIDQ